jgi:predicted small secreted protein
MDDDWFVLIIGIFGGIVIGIVITFGIITDININQETADEICQQLSNETDIEFHAKSLNGKLICERPNFDNTQQIIFREAGG